MIVLFQLLMFVIILGLVLTHLSTLSSEQLGKDTTWGLGELEEGSWWKEGIMVAKVYGKRLVYIVYAAYMFLNHLLFWAKFLLGLLSLMTWSTVYGRKKHGQPLVKG